MTREEAIELLDILPLCNECDSSNFPYTCAECGDAFLLAMEALKQPEVVRCKDCKHRPTQTDPPKTYGFSIEFPKGSRCPCRCEDGFYSWYPNDNWFCADGERKETLKNKLD